MNVGELRLALAGINDDVEVVTTCERAETRDVLHLTSDAGLQVAETGEPVVSIVVRERAWIGRNR